MPRSPKRARRIADLIQHQIGSALKREISDPRLANVAITSVDVAPDLSQARIYFTVLEEKEVENVQKAFVKAQGFLRHLLANSTELRYIPQLHFVYDQSIMHAEKITTLIERAVKADQHYQQDPDERDKSK